MSRLRLSGRHARENRMDDELGLVRYCPRCDEEWPMDDEFWRTLPRTDRPGLGIVCRACARDAKQRSRQRRAA